MAEEDMEVVDVSTSSGGSGTRVSLQIVIAPSTAKKHVSVLILTPQWKFDRYGTSGITRSLIENLRSIDPEGKVIKITVAVLEEEGRIERIKEAEDLKVHLKGYILTGRRKKADEQWLNDYAVNYYHHVVSAVKYDFIIGHAPYFSDGCINLRNISRENGHDPKVILFAHEFPQNENGETEEALFRKWLSEVDVVFSLTTAMRNEIERQMKEIKKGKGKVPLHESYIPGYPIELFHLDGGGKQFKSEREISMFTSMKNDETEGLDFSVAVNAVASACHGLGQTTLTMLTEDKADKEAWEKEYEKVLKNQNQHLIFKCETFENTKDLQNQIGKSDLFLFPLKVSSALFGQEALAAVASGVPVLVSPHSGVGSFLLEMNEKDSVVDEGDERSWANRISEKMRNPVRSHEKAKDLRDRLLLDTRIASTHRGLTKLICDAFSTEVEIKLVSDPSIPNAAIDMAKKIGVNDKSDLHDPENFMIAFFQQILLLRNKLESGLLQMYLTESIEEKWKNLLLFLEKDKRTLLSVHKGCIIFTFFCPTAESFHTIRTCMSDFEELFKAYGFKEPHCTFDDPSSVPQTNDCGNEVSALLLTTRFLFDFTGITTVTRSLVNNLRHHDPKGQNVKLTCAILEKDGRIEQVQVDEAKTQNLTLKGAVQPMGVNMNISGIEQMNGLSASFYHNVFDQGSFDFIIGHAPLFSFGAINLKNLYKDLYKGQHAPKVVLVIHELPRTNEGYLKRNRVRSWIKETDIVFSIGKTTKIELERFLFGKKKHELYIPFYPLEDIQVQKVDKIHHKQITLMVGKKEFEYNGIDLHLAINAAKAAGEMIHETCRKGETGGLHLVLVGEDATDEEHLKTYFSDTEEKEGIFTFDVLTSLKPEDMKSCIIRSSVFLLPLKNNCSKFGLEALSAAAAGVPILVSENSGVAALLQEMGEGKYSVVKRQRYFDLDVQEWKNKIIEIFDNSQEVQDQNKLIRKTLLQNENIARTHLNFISAIDPASQWKVEEYAKVVYKRTNSLENMDHGQTESKKKVKGINYPKRSKEKDPLKGVRIKRTECKKQKRYSEKTANNKATKSEKRDKQNEGISHDLKELTDEKLNKLSRRLTTQSEVRRLGLEGLGLPKEDVGRHLSDHSSDIVTAAYHVLSGWCISQENRTIAYEEMCKALKRVGMSSLISEVLQ